MEVKQFHFPTGRAERKTVSSGKFDFPGCIFLRITGTNENLLLNAREIDINVYARRKFACEPDNRHHVHILPERRAVTYARLELSYYF